MDKNHFRSRKNTVDIFDERNQMTWKTTSLHFPMQNYSKSNLIDK